MTAMSSLDKTCADQLKKNFTIRFKNLKILEIIKIEIHK